MVIQNRKEEKTDYINEIIPDGIDNDANISEKS